MHQLGFYLLIRIFLPPSIFCSDFEVVVLLVHRHLLCEPKSEPYRENVSLLHLLESLAISLVDITLVLITIFHKNTPNTGCPVLGVHITYTSGYF